MTLHVICELSVTFHGVLLNIEVIQQVIAAEL